MDEIRLRPLTRVAANFLVAGVVSSSLCACGSGSHGAVVASVQSPPVVAATPPPDPNLASSSSVQIQTLPAMSPSFDPGIHDYVVKCANASEVLFTGFFGNGRLFTFLGPGEFSLSSPRYPTQNFQRSLALRPGQRLRFSFGDLASEYSVRCLPSDFPPLVASTAGSEAPQAEWYLFAPALFFPSSPPLKPSSYVIITDARGTPVWWKNEAAGQAIDAKVLGPNEIVWTVQTNEPDAQYLIRNFSGQLLKTIGSDLNDHDLQPTKNGTFLAIRDVARICPPDCADMSAWGGSAQTAAVDQEIVELDQSSNVLWTWRTRDHIRLGESGAAGWFPGVGNDIIHMNAVEPDATDGVLFSARHLNAIYRISKSTGTIDWKIGGVLREESLVVVGDTRPSAIGPMGHPLSGQHDVRKWADGTISVHDNGTIASRPPAIVRYRIDTAARTASVVELITDVLDTASICCGSARRLPGGHWLVEWGGLPYLTEVDTRGDPVLTIRYNIDPEFSYRAVPVLPGEVSAVSLRYGMDAMN